MIDSQLFLNFVIKETKSENALNKTEVSHLLIGKYYAFLALIKSKVLENYDQIIAILLVDFDKIDWASDTILFIFEKILQSGVKNHSKKHILSQLVNFVKQKLK